MEKQERTFLGEHPIALMTAYLFFVLFANMYGFWRPFGINVFAYASVSDLFTNAALYVGQSFIVLAQSIAIAGFVLWFLIIAFNHVVPNLARRWPLRRVIKSPPSEFSLHIWLMKIRAGTSNLHELVAVLILLGLLALITLASPYSHWVFVGCSFLSAGMVAGAQVTDDYQQGWRKTLTMALFAVLGLLPAVCYARGSYAAEAIRRSCGTVRYLGPGDALGAGLPVYLGHVGNFIFLFDDQTNQEIAKGVGDESEFRLAYADQDGNVLPIRSNAFGLYYSLSAIQIPDCRKRSGS